MALATEAKPKQFALTLSQGELQMLKDLAEEARNSAAETVRSLVRGAYAKKFKFKIPGADIMPTIRAIIDDISGAEHYTAGNIATRTGLPLPVVHDVLSTLARKGVIECIDHMRPMQGQKVRHQSENWTWELTGPRDRAFAALEKAGLDVDTDLTPKSGGRTID